jgi:integrase/recombinase XerD
MSHSHATELIRAGMDIAYVQKRLGHAQIQTTMNTYSHLSDEDMRAAYNAFLEASKAGNR